MTSINYLALLRGINVGGKNIIKMNELKSFFEQNGCSDVNTYIQSGNVLFRHIETNANRLTKMLEDELPKSFGIEVPLVIVTHSQLRSIVLQAPAGFGDAPELYRYDVLFVKAPATPQDILQEVKARNGVDTADRGEFAVYFSRLISKASSSYLTRIVSSPVYRSITIRNWNTTTKLLAMLDLMNSGEK